MSKVVKVVAGVALLTFGVGGVLGFAGVQFGTSVIGGYALQAVSLLSGASLAGSALAPKVPDMAGVDSHAGQVLQTKKDNVSAVPQVFGECRIGSNIIWQSSSSAVSGTPRKDYWSIQVVSDTELESFEEMYSNEDVMDNKGSDIFTTVHTHIKGYKTSGVTPVSLNSVLFAKNSDGSTILGKDTEASTPFSIHPDWLSRSTGLLSWDSSNLVDNDYGTSGAKFPEWTQIANQWIEVDLQAPELVESMSTYHSDAYFTSGAIKLQYFNGSTWEDASRVYSFCWDDDCSEADFGYGLMTIDVETTNSYQKWRWFYPSVTCSGNSISIRELGIATTGRYDVIIPPSVSFLAVHQVFEANNNEHTQLDNITAKIQGRKVKTITGSGFGLAEYSNNPAEQIATIMTEGLNILSDDIDFISFDNAKDKCSSYGYSSNIVFNSQRNIQSCIVDILATCRGQIIFSQGKWKLKIDEKQQSVAKALTSDDILNGSLTISMKGFSEVANKIDLKYINPNDNWLSAKVEKQEAELISIDGQEIVKTLDIKGVTSTAQANKLAEITLNSIRYSEDASGNRIKQTPLAISFATTVKNAELEVGDVFELQHDLLDRDRKFITLSVETDQSGAMKIAAREYCETHYKNSVGVYLI